MTVTVYIPPHQDINKEYNGQKITASTALPSRSLTSSSTRAVQTKDCSVKHA